MKNPKFKNLIIGFFEDKENIKFFRDNNNKLGVDLCYVCKDFRDNNNDNNNKLFKYVKNNIIVGYLRNNSTKIFLWENSNDNNNIYIDYENFINNDLKLNYIDINEESKKYLIDFLRFKNGIIFSYETSKEKKLYEKNIKDIINISENKVHSQYNLVLYNFSKFKNKENIFFSFINESGIYGINGDLNLSNIYHTYEELKMKKNSSYNKTNNNNSINNNNELLIPEVKEEKNRNDISDDEEENYDIFNDVYFFTLLEKICVVLFSIVITLAIFFLWHNTFYKNTDLELVNNYRK